MRLAPRCTFALRRSGARTGPLRIWRARNPAPHLSDRPPLYSPAVRLPAILLLILLAACAQAPRPAAPTPSTPQPRTPERPLETDEYTLYELLAPESASFHILYEVTA